MLVVLPAQFTEPRIVDSEMVSNLVDDDPIDHRLNLRSTVAVLTNRLTVDGDLVGLKLPPHRIPSQRQSLVLSESVAIGVLLCNHAGYVGHGFPKGFGQ